MVGRYVSFRFFFFFFFFFFNFILNLSCSYLTLLTLRDGFYRLCYKKRRQNNEDLQVEVV